jgi:hypothetical protein
LGDDCQTPAQQTNVEAQMTSVSVFSFLLGCEQIEKKSGHSGVAQNFCDRLIARTAPATSATVRE